MKLRLTIGILAASVLFAACGRFLVVKDKFDGAKKVALVQYAINPHFLLGYPNADVAKTIAADNNIDAFQKQMGNVFQVVPVGDMTANAAYTGAGKDKVDGWYSAKGMRFIDEEKLNNGELTPDAAKKLCADLGVDAVVTITDSWGQAGGGFFKGIAQNYYFINEYDKDGNVVWQDMAQGRSSETFGVPPGGAIASDDENWKKVQSEAFADALGQFKGRLGK
jgi:hypothetical protein